MDPYCREFCTYCMAIAGLVLFVFGVVFLGVGGWMFDEEKEWSDRSVETTCEILETRALGPCTYRCGKKNCPGFQHDYVVRAPYPCGDRRLLFEDECRKDRRDITSNFSSCSVATSCDEVRYDEDPTLIVALVLLALGGAAVFSCILLCGAGFWLHRTRKSRDDDSDTSPTAPAATPQPAEGVPVYPADDTHSPGKPAAEN